MHGGNDVAVADPLAPEPGALAGQWHPAVGRVAPGAPELLFGERSKVAGEVADEVGGKNPFCHVIWIHRPDPLGKAQFCLQFLHHRPELRVGGFQRAGRDIRSIVGEKESLELGRSPQPVFHPVDERLDLLWFCIPQGSGIQVKRVAGAYVNVQALLVNLGRVDPACQDQRRVHGAAPAFREK